VNPHGGGAEADMDTSSNTGHIVAEAVGEYGETIVLVRPDRTISRDEFGGTLIAHTRASKRAE